jgi:hypothetical protein
MAGGARLTRGTGARLLVLLAAVLLLHLAGLEWIATQLQQVTLLRPLATPMFTRLLQQESVAPPAPAPVAAAPARPRRNAITAVAKASAKPPAPAASEAANASDEPSPAASEPIGEAPAPVAEGADTVAPAPREPEVASTPASEPVPAAADAAPSAGPATDATALDSWPVDTRLNYRLGGQFRSGELHGAAWVQWLRQGDRYETRVDIDITLLASLVLTSQGEVAPQGLIPRAYEELRRSGPRAVRLADETITLGDGRRVPRPDGVQDTASQFVELSHRFATGQDRLEVGRSVSFWMARPGGVDLWTYDIVERETLQTGQLGAVEAFHLKPRTIVNPRGNITAELWFAPSLQYLPVRIRVSMGEGTYVDLMVDRIEQR